MLSGNGLVVGLSVGYEPLDSDMIWDIMFSSATHDPAFEDWASAMASKVGADRPSRMTGPDQIVANDTVQTGGVEFDVHG